MAFPNFIYLNLRFSHIYHSKRIAPLIRRISFIRSLPAVVLFVSQLPAATVHVFPWSSEMVAPAAAVVVGAAGVPHRAAAATAAFYMETLLHILVVKAPLEFILKIGKIPQIKFFLKVVHVIVLSDVTEGVLLSRDVYEWFVGAMRTVLTIVVPEHVRACGGYEPQKDYSEDCGLHSKDLYVGLKLVP